MQGYFTYSVLFQFNFHFFAEHVFQMKILEDWNDELKDTKSVVFKNLSSRLEQEVGVL